MTVDQAINASSVGMADSWTPSKRVCKYLIARRFADSIGGIRIIKSYTDPTVVRKLTWNELTSDNWHPCGIEGGGQ